MYYGIIDWPNLTPFFVFCVQLLFSVGAWEIMHYPVVVAAVVQVFILSETLWCRLVAEIVIVEVLKLR